jgi:hypothetical protein
MFAEPEGIDFDAEGNLWVANNNDGLAGIPKEKHTWLVKIKPDLLQFVLTQHDPVKPTATDDPAKPTGPSHFSIYQVPNLNNNTGAVPQFGGLQVDRAANPNHLYVNEQVSGKGRVYDISTIHNVGEADTNELEIVSTNPGNGGIALANAVVTVIPRV